MYYQLGTHLVTSRNYYTHHGIYVGNGMVIHYAGLAQGLKKDCIRKVTLEEFKGSGDLSVYSYGYLLRYKRFSPQEIVGRAESRLGENRYRILWNNCETFANWSTHGDEFSTQTDGKMEREFARTVPPWTAMMPPLNPISTVNQIGRLFDKLFK